MICDPCKAAGNRNQEGDLWGAGNLHSLCSARGCMCQHGTGSQWVTR